MRRTATVTKVTLVRYHMDKADRFKSALESFDQPDDGPTFGVLTDKQRARHLKDLASKHAFHEAAVELLLQ
jgi:hypothetical protein